MKNLQYLMDSTCTITALIIWHLSYHSQAGIWQHLCVHTGKHSTWNIHNISKFEWQLIEMFFRIWELTHYAYCIEGKYHGEKDHSFLNLQILMIILVHRRKKYKNLNTHIGTTCSFFWSVNYTSSLSKGLQYIVHVLCLNLYETD